MGKYYRDYADFLAEHFDGKMQKLTVDAGFSCPNRDGTIGQSGCIYCNNSSFSPLASRGARAMSVTAQLEEGKRFFEHKYPSMRYLAYFQSYTGTHGRQPHLLGLYREALAVDKVDGLIIGTRPDCIPQPLLDAIASLGAPVIMEYGAESSFDSTLAAINRCHTWADTVDAVRRTAAAGLPVGLHLIMGLPGETREMMTETLRRVADLPVQTLKLHQLQVIDHTPLAAMWRRGEADVTLFSVEEYVDFCAEAVELLRKEAPHIALERFTSQAPAEMLLAPKWGLKNYQFVNLLHNRLAAMHAQPQ